MYVYNHYLCLLIMQSEDVQFYVCKFPPASSCLLL